MSRKSVRKNISNNNRNTPSLDNEEEEYEVEYIINHRQTPSDHREYYVKWLGEWEVDGTTWQPEGHLDKYPELLEDYWTKVQRKEEIDLDIEQGKYITYEPLDLTGINPDVKLEPIRGTRPFVPRKTITAPSKRVEVTEPVLSQEASTACKHDYGYLTEANSDGSLDSPPSNRKRTRSNKAAKARSSRKKTYNDQYEVEYVMGAKLDDQGEEFFLVKWKDWDMKWCDWEPAENLSQAASVVETFYASHRKPAERNTVILSSQGRKVVQDYSIQ